MDNEVIAKTLVHLIDLNEEQDQLTIKILSDILSRISDLENEITNLKSMKNE